MRCPFCIKICSKCKRILVANEINFRMKKQKNGERKLNSQCRICEREYAFDWKKKNSEKYKEYKQVYDEEHREYFREKNKQWREENKEKNKQKNKEWRENNKEHLKEYQKKYNEENKEMIAERAKKYRKENEERLKKYDKEYRELHKEDLKRYYEENKDRISKRGKEYYKDNPEKFFNKGSKRRLLEENQGDGITKEQWLEMMKFFDWKCAYSGTSLNKNNRSIDHIIPLSFGGEHEIWNCAPMIKSYNSSKYTNDMIDWYIEQEFFDIDRLLKIYNWMEYAYKKWKGEE